MFFNFSLFSSRNSTNSTIPPSNLNSTLLGFFWVRSVNIILIPLFKKASSLILFCKVKKLNLFKENISLDGKNFISVPVFFDLPTTFKGDFASPFLNSIKCFFPSLSIVSSSFSDNAFTTETPTPCKPPETLYES